jgi:glycerate dehydrogenase
MSATLVVLDGHALNPGDLSWDALAACGKLTVYERTAPADVIARASGSTVVLTNKTPLDAAFFSALPELKFVSVLATGYNIVDVAAARRAGVPVSNVPTYGTETVAQHAFALLLELCHEVGAHAVSVRDGEWAASPDFGYWKSPLIELAGRRLGVVGRGRIGQRMAALGRAFGMDVVFASGSHPEGGEGILSIDELFSTSDAVSLHCPATPATIGFVNARLLGRMKPGAFLINTARGSLIDESALAAALRDGTLGGAALDVLSVEPPPTGHPLIGAPNCLITPHMA